MVVRSYHTCHWPGCTLAVKPRLWGCRAHWYQLPIEIRQEIWRTYRPGQEVDKQPSRAYVAAARKAQDYAREYEATKAQGGKRVVPVPDKDAADVPFSEVRELFEGLK